MSGPALDPRLELSLCLIVRDEAPRLRRCVESFADVPDELVIVDTGSVDGTQDVARDLLRGRAGRLETFAWRDDFAAARNFACALCRAPWILMIDADELLAPGQAPRAILDEVRRAPPGVKNLLLVDYTLRDGVPVLAHPVNRLFRNDPAVRWVGKIHETLTVGPDEQRMTRLALLHDNQAKRAEGGRLSPERSRMYEAGLLADVRAEPGNPRHRFYLGNTLSERGEHAAAARAFDEYLALADDANSGVDERFQARINAAWCRRRLGELDLARRHLLDAVALLPLRNESYLSLGDVALDAGRLDEARHWYQVACGVPQPAQSLFLDVSSYRAGPWWQLGTALIRLGDLESARLATERARAWAPDVDEVRERLVNLHLALEAREAPPTVVIPSRAPALAARCLEAVLAAEGDVYHEALVVCDGDAAPFEPLLGRFPRLRLLAAPRPFVLARSVNLAVAATVGDVVLLSDDAEPLARGWLDELRAVSRAGPDVGLVAATLVAAGRDVPAPGEAARAAPADAVPFACVYLPRATLAAAGPLDEGFVWSGSEDDDYCARVARLGRRLLVATRALVRRDAPAPADAGRLERWRARARRYLLLKARAPACDLLVVARGAGAADGVRRLLATTRADARVVVVAEAAGDEALAAALQDLDDPRLALRLEARAIDDAALLDDLARASPAPLLAQARPDAGLPDGWLEALLAAHARGGGLVVTPRAGDAGGGPLPLEAVGRAGAWLVERAVPAQLGVGHGAASAAAAWQGLAARLAARGRPPRAAAGPGCEPGAVDSPARGGGTG